ncbi:hypothetical protein [Ruegeria atlantica]|nr:hypothetical protein [Ruegeria atlantica]
MGVSLATGAYGSYEEAIGQMTRRKSEFLPNVTMQSHCDLRYTQHFALIEAMRGFWEAEQNSIER